MALSSAQIPPTLEPSGLNKLDATVSLLPYGKLVVLLSGTQYAQIHLPYLTLPKSTRAAGAVADHPQALKKSKYLSTARAHHFVPVAIETCGVFSNEAKNLLLTGLGL